MCQSLRNTSAPDACPARPASVSRRDRIVSLARLHLQIMIARAQSHAAERTIKLLVGRRVADCVLAAHLLLQLFKNLRKGVLLAHVKDSPARFFRHRAE